MAVVNLLSVQIIPEVPGTVGGKVSFATCFLGLEKINDVDVHLVAAREEKYLFTMF